MPKEAKGGVKPPLIGKFTGRLRTPISIFAGFFVLGFVADVILHALALRIEGLRRRFELGFKFWVFVPAGTWGETSIALDDLLLLIVSFGILLLYKIRLKLRIIAAAGFFVGWYICSQFFSEEFQDVIGRPNSDSSATEGM